MVDAELKQKVGGDPNANKLHISARSTARGIDGKVTFRDTALLSRELTGVGISLDGRTAWVSGVGMDGRRFTIYAEVDDVARIWIGGVLQNGTGIAANGRVHIQLE